MVRSSRKRRSAGWPFWLLIAAWFCANSPQVAVYEVVLWLGNARHFSHQQRLQAEVASLLSGKKAVEVRAVTKDTPAHPLVPLAPPDGLTKKIELVIQRSGEFLPPVRAALVRTESFSRLPATRRDQPPHEPPRMRFIDC